MPKLDYDRHLIQIYGNECELLSYDRMNDIKSRNIKQLDRTSIVESCEISIQCILETVREKRRLVLSGQSNITELID
jgi:hypothetical protein